LSGIPPMFVEGTLSAEWRGVECCAQRLDHNDGGISRDADVQAVNG
jgi:hypothetical protein